MDTKRKLQPEEIETIHNIAKKLRALRKEKIKHKIVTSEEANKIETQSRDQKKRKRKENEDIHTKKRCLKILITNSHTKVHPMEWFHSLQNT
jgi:hypothetical protein